MIAALATATSPPLPLWVTPVLTVVGILLSAAVTTTVARMVNPWDKRARERIESERELVGRLAPGTQRDLLERHLDEQVRGYVGRVALPPDIRLGLTLSMAVGGYGVVLLAAAMVSFAAWRDPSSSGPMLLGSVVSLAWFFVRQPTLERRARRWRLAHEQASPWDSDEESRYPQRWWRRLRRAWSGRRSPRPPDLDDPDGA